MEEQTVSMTESRKNPVHVTRNIDDSWGKTKVEKTAAGIIKGKDVGRHTYKVCRLFICHLNVDILSIPLMLFIYLV